MKKLISYLIISFFVLTYRSEASAARLEGGQYTVTRTLLGTSGGVNLNGSNGYSVSYAAGESVATNPASNLSVSHGSGYYAGWIGSGMSLKYLSSQIPASGPMLNGIQIGLGPDGVIELTFSDQLDASSLASGVVVTLLQDHLGHAQTTSVPISVYYAPTGTLVTVSPKGKWPGNSIFELVISPNVQSLDGFALENPVVLRFLTLLDPSVSNVVLQPLDAGMSQQSAGASASYGAASGPVSLTIASQSLRDYSMILVNSNPQNQSTRIDPAIIQDANRTAARVGGSYMVPLSVHEINAYNQSMEVTNRLSSPAQLSMSYTGSLILTPDHATVRADTLSLWVLDEEHHLWVQMPDTLNNAKSNTVSVSVPRLGVYAIMGQAAGNAQATNVFPNPWRPHGPHAGIGSGETGTLSGGITFSNIPSECTITIYSVSGELVSTLHHSDLNGSIGQERWLGTTSGGDVVASGVYIWRIQSQSDSKTGKLVIVR